MRTTEREKSSRQKRFWRLLAIDIGGAGIKMMKLSQRGRPLSKRIREKTPRPATPEALLTLIKKMANRLQPFDRISVGFPGVVKNGVTLTAANLHPSWKGVKLEAILKETFKKPTRVANDADVQGLASIKGKGVELVITLGTGVGTALFVDGTLVPNLELGHHPFMKSKTYEDLLGEASLKKIGVKRWNVLLRKALENWTALFSCDEIHLGGGNTRLIKGCLPPHVRIVSNRGGLFGGLKLWAS